MNHVVISPGPGEIGYGCKCGKRFPTQKTADLHAKDQNLIEENEAKAKKAEGQATEHVDSDVVDLARAELGRRGTTIDAVVEVSGHAIDRASLSPIRGVWKDDRQPGEGLHAWLTRVATEAFEAPRKRYTKTSSSLLRSERSIPDSQDGRL